MTAFRVVFDACVLLPQNLNNLLLTLADAELFQPVWTSDLLDEVERNLSGERFGKTAEQAARRVAQMRAAFPFAEEESRGYRELIPVMTNDPKDRHVLAAAVRSGAGLIVTSNLKDFPKSSLDPFDVDAIHPDEFLCDQLDLEPDTVFECMNAMVDRNRLPPSTIGELLRSMEGLVPNFVAAVRALLVAQDEAASDVVSSVAMSFPELTDEAVASLEPGMREAYLYLRALDPVERVRFMGHTELVSAAWAFLTPVCVQGDLLSVWSLVDPGYRTVLARKWVRDNHRDILADGWDGEAVASALAEPAPDHPLWTHFERVHIRGIRSLVPAPASWGIGTETRMVSPDLELLYIHDTSTLEGGVWRSGEAQIVCPILLRLVDGKWLVRNLGSEDDLVAES
ncbi:PIN domain-containing protein [Rhodococcus sp. ABRD24]|uniref:PIN domain-containing protein n=1 Tax=Rhodococcus sp. ABRD24 TaxID=2507582 RepID=UPI00103D7D0C|nr:PIN domain-containing protein [Rhodococcus sp. ABRD24]QBJ96032.1 PIN domain-containing protein [Rhodococcus sp. ABRD24]